MPSNVPAMTATVRAPASRMADGVPDRCPAPPAATSCASPTQAAGQPSQRSSVMPAFCTSARSSRRPPPPLRPDRRRGSRARAVRFRPRDPQQVIDPPVEAPGRGSGSSRRPLGGLGRALEAQLGPPSDHGQRGAQLVADIGKKAAAIFIRAGQFAHWRRAVLRCVRCDRLVQARPFLIDPVSGGPARRPSGWFRRRAARSRRAGRSGRVTAKSSRPIWRAASRRCSSRRTAAGRGRVRTAQQKGRGRDRLTEPIHVSRPRRSSIPDDSCRGRAIR